MTEQDPTPKRSLIEQHFQTILLTVITAALLYAGTFVLQAREDAVRTTAQLSALGSQLSTLTGEVAGLRSQLVVMQAAFVTREEFRDHEARLRHLEGRK